MNKILLTIVSAVLCLVSITGINPAFTKNEKGPDPNSLFEEAVDIIKKYETLHQPRHWPFVGQHTQKKRIFAKLPEIGAVFQEILAQYFFSSFF